MNLIKQILVVFFVSIATLKIADVSFGFFQSQSTSSSLAKGTDRSIVLRELNPNQYASIRPNNNYMKDVENLEQIDYEINIDEDGFIKTGNHVELSPDIKILFLGGSTTETLYVPEKNRFPSVVERNLRSQLTQTINIFNGGVSGNNSMHSLFALLAKGIALEPNYVVLMHNINDFALLSKTESYWIAPRSRAVLVKNNDGKFSTIEDSSRNIFFNLIKNSIESIQQKEQKNPNFNKEISIEIKENNDHIFITIIDNGLGFDIFKNNIKDILHPYFTTKKNGTGLGLSIVNKIINDHNGKIEFIPINQGAKVNITFNLNDS